MNCVPEVKLFGERGKIIGISIHLVSIPGLGGAAVPTAVMGNHAVAALSEVQHLIVPVIGGERPTVAEDYWLS
jgi:hypothetical protein